MSDKDIFQALGPNAGYAKDQYELYLVDPALVDPQWHPYFSQIASAGSNGAESGAPASVFAQPLHPQQLAASPSFDSEADLAARCQELFAWYRRYGHLRSAVSPLIHESSLQQRFQFGQHQPPELFSKEELSAAVPSSLPSSIGGLVNIADLHQWLESSYAGVLSIEASHLLNEEEQNWLYDRFEKRDLTICSLESKEILKYLIDAQEFEESLHRKYIGHKRFSLQGCETLIPCLIELCNQLAELDAQEMLIGMPHRGRLTVLCQVLGKPLEEIFDEFEGQSIDSSLGSGDVKYHIGFSGARELSSGRSLHLELLPNPSHLEFVDPVVVGAARAKQDIHYDRNRQSVVPVLLHGDAAFIGQGVVAETFNLSLVPGYRVDGTIHIVVNNQIGFTTQPEEARSAPHCSEFAKCAQAPILHVNAESPHEACWAIALAAQFRAKFKRDVVVDLVGYRKYGHNEGDDPSYTQPLMARKIKERESIASLYNSTLVSKGAVSAEDFETWRKDYRQQFEIACDSDAPVLSPSDTNSEAEYPSSTAVEHERLVQVANTLLRPPEGFSIHPKLERIMRKRVEALEAQEPVDWAFSENLAFGSLLQDGAGVRLSGQDCGRGTFSQRHLMLCDYETGKRFYPLNLLVGQASTESYASKETFGVYNSPLSEAAVMGFEFGYSTFAQNSLVLWEGQFGDFVNGAQVIIDQFLVSSETKWGQLSGLTLLLPHGFEGQGPEHSSARLERFLTLGAENNVTIAMPSTASQYFHLLRRHGLTKNKRPLIVMTPKSMLRLPAAASPVSELVSGEFQPVRQVLELPRASVDSVVLCSGKVVHEVDQFCSKNGIGGVAIFALEQLYPFPEEQLRLLIATYSNASNWIWLQEEPQNMGAWRYISQHFSSSLSRNLNYIGRKSAASPAAGSATLHEIQQSKIFEQLALLVS